MEQNNIEQQESGITLSDVWQILKSNIILMLVVVVLSTAVGGIFALTQKPSYTASNSYKMRARQSTSQSYTDTTLTQKLLPSVADFVTSGCVIDRANYYYDCYVTGIDNGTYADFADFLLKLKAGEITAYSKSDFEKLRVKPSHILPGSLSSVFDSEMKTTFIMLTYSGADYYEVKQKLLVYAEALVREVKLQEDGEYVYFTAEVVLEDVDDGQPNVSTVSKKKTTLLIAFAIGLVLAVGLAFLVYVLDDTMRSKQELERITGVRIFAYIDDELAEESGLFFNKKPKTEKGK